MVRQTRLFALAEHLRGRRTGVTAGELAERFRVTVRTIYRDGEALSESEILARASVLHVTPNMAPSRSTK